MKLVGIPKEGGMWPGTESNCRHEDFQSSYLPRLCVTIGHQVNEFKRLNRFSLTQFLV